MIYSGMLNAANPALQNRNAAFAPLSSSAVTQPFNPHQPSSGTARGADGAALQGSVAPGAFPSLSGAQPMPAQMASQLALGAPGAQSVLLAGAPSGTPSGAFAANAPASNTFFGRGAFGGAFGGSGSGSGGSRWASGMGAR